MSRDHTVLPATHTFIHKWNETYLLLGPTPQPQSITALWLLLISRPAEGRRLSWLGWLDEILRWFARPKTVTHPSTSRGGRESNLQPSSRESNALTTRPPNHRVPVIVFLVKLNLQNYTVNHIIQCNRYGHNDSRRKICSIRR